jgi:hypothetical protein
MTNQSEPTRGFDFHLKYKDQKGKNHHKVFTSVFARTSFIEKNNKRIISGSCSINYLDGEGIHWQYDFKGEAEEVKK